MQLSHDPVMALREIRGFLEAMPIDADHELTRDGTVYGYWLPIEYLDGLLAICRQLKGISHDYGQTKQEAIQTLQEFLRWRGYERAILNRDGGLKPLLRNEHQARLMLFEIFERAVAQGAEAQESLANELGLTREEIQDVVRFGVALYVQGQSQIGVSKAAKSKRSKRKEDGDAPT